MKDRKPDFSDIMVLDLAAQSSSPYRFYEELLVAEPMTMRYRLYHLPAKLTRHARYRVPAIERTWPWAQVFTACWRRLGKLPAFR